MGVTRFFAVGALVCVFLLGSAGASGDVVFFHSFETDVVEGGFDNGGYTHHSVLENTEEEQPPNSRAEWVTSPAFPVRDGAKAIRFRTSGHDTGVHRSRSWERSEYMLSQADSHGYAGEERWWAISVYFPDDHLFPTAAQMNGGSLFFQWHGSGNAGLPPITAYNSYTSQFVPSPRLVMRFQVSFPCGGRDRFCRRDFSRTPRKNVWYDFIVNVKWSHGSDGRVRIWAREAGQAQGELVMDYSGRNLYDGEGAYFKFGRYGNIVEETWTSTIIDRLVMGTTVESVRWFPLEGMH